MIFFVYENKILQVLLTENKISFSLIGYLTLKFESIPKSKILQFKYV